jgi:predicted Rossmann fold flavoprotein
MSIANNVHERPRLPVSPSLALSCDMMNSTLVYKAIIIGAGPAGLFAAIRLAEALAALPTAATSVQAPASGILLLERCENPARKLLLSGSGQCNITHAGTMADFLGCYGGGARPESAARFLKPALYGFTNEELLSWFRARGIDFETEENGKIFPADHCATTILHILLDEAARLGVKIETKRRVSAISCITTEATSSGARGGFLVRVEGPSSDAPEQAEYTAPIVLIATGGASYPKTGSSGDGYTLAASLGHHIVAPKAALTPVFVRNFTLATLAGLSFHNAGLTIRRGGKRIHATDGDLLITHEGLSGPLILDSSRYIEAGDTIEIRFVDTSPAAFREQFDAELQANPRRLVRTILAECSLTKSMAERFCDLAGLGQDDTAAALPRAQRETLCRLACASPFIVDRLGPLDTAMATAGGVDLVEVNPKTLESRLAPGLYFAGEVLDIDGDTGGYNLQAAFSTGALAASQVSKRARRSRIYSIQDE